jgi:hypothetical protein
LPLIQNPEAKPPRRNSSAIWRSLPAQNGHEPCSERFVRLGETPTPNVSSGR